jgi:regulator of protease activity HflC (stomatin/prohibitin superfamily)
MSQIISIFLWFIASLLLFALASLAIYKASEHDICFTQNQSGRIKAIVAGKQVVKWIGWIPGHEVNPETGAVSALASGQPEKEKSFFDQILQPLGISFVGLWPFHKIYRYEFKWTEWVTKDNSTENVPMPRKEETDHVRFRFPYLIKISEVETKGKVPINVLVLITTEVKNASLMLFNSGGEWLSNMSASVQSATRDWIGDRELEDITSAQNEGENSPFVECILNLNGDNGNTGLKLLGFEIKIANFLSYEVVGEDKVRLQKATTEQYVAEQEAAAKKARAKGEADAIKEIASAEAEATIKRGDAKAEAARKILDALASHPDGAQIEMAEKIAEAIKGSKITTLVTGGGANPLLQIVSGQQPRESKREQNEDDTDDNNHKSRKKKKTPEVNSE